LIKAILNRKRLSLGILYFVVLIVLSFIYSFYLKDHLPHIKKYYRDTSGVIHSVPYSPIEFPPFGTDRGGINMFWKVIGGAKFTIGTVLFVSIIQVIISILLGAILSFSFSPIRKAFTKFAQIFNYIPIVLILYFIMPALNAKFEEGHIVLIVWQLIILICVSVPSLSLYIADEIGLIMKKEYIINAKILGGSKYFIFMKHVWSNLKEKVLLMFFKQCTQIMFLLTQIGLFSIFIGGGSAVEFEVHSFSNEWSGLIGASRLEIFVAPWILLVPLLFLTLSIFIMNMIYKQIEEVIGENKQITNLDQEKKEKKEKKDVSLIDKRWFEIIKQG
jgi:peptide/nickel transport system permease protein